MEASDLCHSNHIPNSTTYATLGGYIPTTDASICQCCPLQQTSKEHSGVCYGENNGHHGDIQGYKDKAMGEGYTWKFD